jgi:hypothetical protein
MSVISNIWRQLVQRRLWPVAILLIAALAAVPLTLAKGPESSPAPAPDVTSEDSGAELATEPIVALASAGDRAKRRKVLGKPKNPFVKPVAIGGAAQDGPQPAPAAKSPEGGGGPEKLADDITINAGGAPSPSSSSPSGPTTGTPAPPSDTPAPEDRPEPDRDSLTIRFGDASGDSLERMNVKRLEALPLLVEEPLVVYLGVGDGGDSAVFLLDTSVRGEGDGECMPDPSTCETIHLREGETEFFDVLGEDGEPSAQFQLDLVEIHAGKKASAAKVKSASRPVRRVLRARAAGPGALHYRLDSESGTLRLGSGGAVRATVGRTADVGLALP